MAIPLTNGEGKLRDEIYKSMKVRNPRKTCDVPSSHWDGSGVSVTFGDKNEGGLMVRSP